MYGPNDTLDTDSYYTPPTDAEQYDLDVEYYWSNGWDDGPDPDDARDRMIEDDRWDGVS